MIVSGTISSASPAAAYFPAQPPSSSLPTPSPSPFLFPVTSTRWSSRPPFHLSNVFLRFFALLFSFASALSLAGLSPKKNNAQGHSSFYQYPELMYCFIVTILIFLYSAYQLFKGVCDIAYRGILISDMTSDYISFILDQLAGYLLVSSSSVTISAIQQIEGSPSLRKATIVSVSMSFAGFLAIVACGFLSGYKLCKRIGW